MLCEMGWDVAGGDRHEDTGAKEEMIPPLAVQTCMPPLSLHIHFGTMVAFLHRHCKHGYVVNFWVTRDSYVNAAFRLQSVFGNEYNAAEVLHIYCSSR